VARTVATESELVFEQDMKTGGIDNELEFSQSSERTAFAVSLGGLGNESRSENVS